MSKQNKFFAAATTAALVASAIVPVASAAEFKDANQIAPWATEAVETLAAKDIIGGNPDGSFNPKGNVTRAEAAKMFKVALDLPVQGTESFTDVKDGQWFQDVIIAVSNAGIVDGMGNGLFVPNGKLTRAEAAKMIVKAYGFEGEADLSKFADADKVAGKWFEAPLSTAVATGIIAGKGNLLAANDSITRQEFAVMLTRAIDTAQEANTEELLAAVEKATTALDTAVKALNTVVKANEIALAKAEVVAAKEAVTALEKSVVDAKDVMTTELTAKTTAAIATAKKAIEATEAVIVKAEEDAKVLAVESIKGINATQVEIKFNKPVDKTTVLDANGKLVANVANFVELGTAKTITEADLTGELSKDGKTLVVTAAGTDRFEGRYDITIDGLKDQNGKAMVKYVGKTVEFGKDTVAPVVTGTERISASQVKVLFSEPVTFAAGAVTADTLNVKAEGAAVAALAKTAVTEVVIDLSDASIAVGKEVKLTFNGVEDAAGNLISPQPTSVTIKKESSDVQAPSLVAVAQTGINTFTLTFDKVTTLAKNGVTLSDATVKSVEKVSDTVYKVTTNENLKGLQRVTVLKGKATNIDGIATTADLSKTVTFVTDETAPKATSKLVTVNGMEYIELTFDKNVELKGAKRVTIAGTYVDNFVTKTLAPVDVVAQYADAKQENKKVVLLPLTNKDLAIKGATYDVKIVNKAEANGIVSEAGKAIEELTAKFTRGENTPVAETNKAVVKSAEFKAVANNNDQVKVVFTIDGEHTLDGQTATNVNNYSVSGAVIESVTLEPATTTVDDVKVTTQTAILNLQKNSNTFTGVRNATVKGIKVAGSTIAMEETALRTEALTENVRPTLTSVVLTDGKNITLTFSEAIETETLNAAAFDVKVGEVLEEGATASVVGGKVIITLEDSLTNEELVKTITVAPTQSKTDNASNFVVKDTAGNALEIFDVRVAAIAQ